MAKQAKSSALKKVVAKKAAKPAASKAKAAPKVIEKKVTLSKKNSTTSSNTKKAPTAAKVKEPASVKAKKDKEDAKQLDLCLLMDCTSSMHSWIQRSKDTLKQIIDTVKQENSGLKVRISFVGYRDIRDSPRFVLHDFTEDVDKIKSFISKVQAQGGADLPEDVQGGFNKAFQQSWGQHSIKQCFMIADAPGHGRNINGLQGAHFGDDFPEGSPDGFIFEDQMKEFARREMNFTIVKVNSCCNAMIEVMRANYDKPHRSLFVTDLEKACLSGNQAEVTKQFVDAASFMLSVAVGGPGKGKKGGGSAPKPIKRTGEPLWDPKKFEPKQWFSQVAYLTVRDLGPTQVRVENSYGMQMDVSRDILENMWSASHFDTEVHLSMTDLAALMETMGDTAFSIQFRKKPNEAAVVEKLNKLSLAEVHKQAADLSKELTEGKTVTMVCKLVNLEPSLGRSTVIDFSANTENKFRQVDHRTIDNIIFKNVRYILKKSGSKKPGEEAIPVHKKGDPKWNHSKLEVGNTFSGTAYYKAQELLADNRVMTKCDDKEIVISRDILEYEMNNASVFTSEEKLSLTKVAQILENEVNSTCFTVCFNCKIDEKEVQTRLSKLTQTELKDSKKLAKEILTGKQSTFVGHIAKNDAKLGRTLMIELNQKGFRQIDHRSINYLIVRNVKYTVGK